MKLIYVIAALAMLAMLIPAMAVPVSAGNSYTMPIELQWVHMVNGVQVTDYIDPDGALNGDGVNEGFNVAGSIIRVTAPGTPSEWNLDNVTTHYSENGVNFGEAHWVGGDPNLKSTIPTQVLVQGTWGEATITATVGTTVYTAKKKWGMITGTDITPPQTTTVTWNEASKSWFADGEISDTVTGAFIGAVKTHVAQGAVLNWYLVSGDENVSLACDYAGDLKTYVEGLDPAQYVQFIDPTESVNWAYDKWYVGNDGWLGTCVQNITDKNGVAGVDIGAWFEEAVQIVVIPEYPNYPNRLVCPEITSFNFGTREMELVPQVRWSGEKIVLEANFGAGMGYKDVLFYFQNQSVGTLEGLDDDSEAATVWAETDSNGVASAILYSSVPGQSDVIAALYPHGRDAQVTNQYAFRVYFLNFENLQLTNVPGKRTGHYEGLFEPANPWKAGVFDATKKYNYPGEPDLEDPNDPYDDVDSGYDYNLPINDPTATDVLFEELNVSQDALLRAKVKGWFTNTMPSSRTAGVIPNSKPGKPGLLLPAGRWVLPDDWDTLATLAGNWQENRLFWDIMDAPNDSLTFPWDEVIDADGDEITGPFTPGNEMMTPCGWQIDALSDRQTVVPNDELDYWDAPMPPAKVILDIVNKQVLEGGVNIGNSGYFKSAMKTDIYYQKNGGSIVYTAPFYQVLIPAHQAIPPFNIQPAGGYDWNSFDGTHGPYEFWTIINKPAGKDWVIPVVSTDPGMRPTKVEVYSDNHGEAMVWLNGDWNLNLSAWDDKGGADVPFGTRVGSTTVEAMVDYPYVRANSPIYSNTVTKDWVWGGEVVGTDETIEDYYDDDSGDGDAYTGPAMVLTGGGTGAITITNGKLPTDTEAWGTSNDHVIWVWVTDRDGLRKGVEGAVVQWQLTGVGNPTLYSGAPIHGINSAGQWSPQIDIDENGFLDGTDGEVAPANMSNIVGWSTLKEPTTAEKNLFIKTYPNYTLAEAANFAVAAIDVETTGGGENTVQITIASTDFAYWDMTVTPKKFVSIGTIKRTTNFDAATPYPLDDQILPGDANVDKVVNMLDITTVERYILGLDTVANASADANFNHVVDMGDVVKIERIYLGLE